MKQIYIFFFSCIAITAFSQSEEAVTEKVNQTFRNSRVINSHSVETLPAGKMDFRIVHRFGDLAGSAGGWPTFYGLENASDVLIGFEYGLSDNFMMGVSRTKGSGPLKQNVIGLAKFRLMSQERNGNNPLGLAVVFQSTVSTMPKSETEGVLSFFEKSAHRWGYHLGIHIARKFSERFSMQLNAAWTYRNLVSNNDQNDLVSAGGSIKIQVTKAFGLILDTTFPFSNLRKAENGYYPAIGLGLEFDTSGGHVFQINLTNATGIVENDYIPYTRSNWADGQFRLGFTVSRLFSL